LWDITMIEIAATEFAKRLTRYRQAAQCEPVAVSHRGRITVVLIAKHDYDDYVRLKRLATRALRVEDMSDEAIEALETAEMNPSHAHLDALG
jgi:PHD/YefM family antitoxin component YafN of YafNO toxin-antitoxin module